MIAVPWYGLVLAAVRFSLQVQPVLQISSTCIAYRSVLHSYERHYGFALTVVRIGQVGLGFSSIRIGPNPSKSWTCHPYPLVLIYSSVWSYFQYWLVLPTVRRDQTLCKDWSYQRRLGQFVYFVRIYSVAMSTSPSQTLHPYSFLSNTHPYFAYVSF